MKPVKTIQGDLLPFKKECGLYQIQLGRAGKYKASLIYVKDESEQAVSLRFSIEVSRMSNGASIPKLSDWYGQRLTTQT